MLASYVARNRAFFLLAGASVLNLLAAGLYGGVFFDPEETYERTAYWFMWAHLLFLAWAVAPPEILHRCWTWLRRRQTWVMATAATLLTIMMIMSVGREFRVLADETNLIGTSFSLYLDRTAQNIIEGDVYFGRFNLLRAEMPTRPLLFPFAMSILHGLFGFDADHGFVVNALASVGTLLAVAALAVRLGGPWLAGLAGVMLAAFPLYAQCVTASGYEVLNLMMVMLVGGQLWQFLRQPRGDEAALLVILTLLAAQCRYESVLLLVPVGLSFLLHARALLSERLPLTLALLPNLLLPTIWQRLLSVAVNAGDVGKEPFPLKELPTHLQAALLYFLNWPRGNYATIGPVFVVAVVGLALALLAVLRARRSGDATPLHFAVLAAIGFGGILLVQCAYYLGDMRQAFISRMGLTFVGALSMLAASAVVRLAARAPELVKPAAIVAALGLCVHGWSHAAVNQHGRTLLLYREYRRTLDFMQRRGNDRDNTLIISDRPSMFAARGRGSVSLRWARKETGKILKSLQRHRYHEILVIQHLVAATGKPEPGFELSLALVPVYEFLNSEKTLIRISQVTGPAGPDEPVPESARGDAASSADDESD